MAIVSVRTPAYNIVPRCNGFTVTACLVYLTIVDRALVGMGDNEEGGTDMGNMG